VKHIDAVVEWVRVGARAREINQPVEAVEIDAYFPVGVIDLGGLLTWIVAALRKQFGSAANIIQVEDSFVDQLLDALTDFLEFAAG